MSTAACSRLYFHPFGPILPFRTTPCPHRRPHAGRRDRRYQQRSVMLADEMGLGKTAQAIAMLDYIWRSEGVRGPFLVVAPLSTLSHWQREVESWTDLNVLLYHGRCVPCAHAYLPRSYRSVFFLPDLTRPHPTFSDIRSQYALTAAASRVRLCCATSFTVLPLTPSPPTERRRPQPPTPQLLQRPTIQGADRHSHRHTGMASRCYLRRMRCFAMTLNCLGRVRRRSRSLRL